MVEYKVPKIIVIQLGSVISKEMHSEIEVKKVTNNTKLSCDLLNIS
jgi:hypothetical protein